MELRPPLHIGDVAIEKGVFGSPSTKVANFTCNDITILAKEYIIVTCIGYVVYFLAKF